MKYLLNKPVLSLIVFVHTYEGNTYVFAASKGGNRHYLFLIFNQ